MPWRAKAPCRKTGCPNLVPCPAHPILGRWEGRPNNSTAKGYGFQWQQVRRAVLVRDGYRCYGCGALATQVDHLVPKVQGGMDTAQNLVATCQRCHSTKTGREGQARRP